MKAIIRYILLTAARDWLFYGVIGAVVLCSVISTFLGSTALSEQNQMQIAFISGSSRLVLVVGMVLFICFHIRRSFDNREIEFIISRPISRSTFLFAYFFSFLTLAFLIIVPVSLIIYFIFKPNLLGFLFWSISLFFELTLMSSFAILASLILNSAVSSVLGCFAFYIVSRIIGFAVSYIIIPAKLNNISFNTGLELMLKGLSSVIPRLDQYAQSKWLIYGGVQAETVYLILIQTAIYVTLILLMSIYDLSRKEF